MKLVYIAGAITKGDLAHNINQGTAAFLALTKAGIASICPMWSVFSGEAFRNPACMSEVIAVASAKPNELTHAEWLAVDFEFIRRSDAVLRLPGESVGADAEVKHAQSIGVPVFDSVEAVIAWAHPMPNMPELDGEAGP